MIVVFRHKSNGKLYVNMRAFAFSSFDFRISDEGEVTLRHKGEDILISFSYKMEDFTREEILNDLIKTNQFKDICRSRYYSIFQVDKQIV